MMPTLSARREKVLRAIIEEYVATATPVGSEAVSRGQGLGVSPATIRNEMAALEDEGFITRPHASAGGVPADKGYRYYVEFIPDLPELPQEVKLAMRRRFEQVDRDVETWTRLAAQLLSDLAHNLSVATYPRAGESRLRHLEAVYLQEVLVLLIMVLQEVRVRKELLPLKEPVNPQQLNQVVNKLNAHFAGLSRGEILNKSVELTPLEQQVREGVVRIMEEEDRAASSDYLTQGLWHLLAQPEFEDPPRVRELVEALEQHQLVPALLQETPEMGSFRVVIGAENQNRALKPLSVVIAQYGVLGGAAGTVAILGPTRMEYQKSIAGVQYLSFLMSAMIEGVHGQPPVS